MKLRGSNACRCSFSAVGFYLTVPLWSSGVSAHQDAALLLNSLDALEKCSFRADLEYRWVTCVEQSVSHAVVVLHTPVSSWKAILLMIFFSSFLLWVRTGCLLGLALVLVALCDIEQTDLHVRITQTLDRLVSNLQDGGQGRMLQEVMSTAYHGWKESLSLFVCLTLGRKLWYF